MALPATQIRRGMVIVFENDPCRIIEFRHHTPGNLRAMVQAKLKNLRSGNNFEHRFRADDQLHKADMETHELQFLYKGGDSYHFMNTENYEQVEISSDELGEAANWLSAGLKLQVQFYESKPIGIELPKSIRVKVTETQPNMKGATASASYKPAVLENGVTIQVPPFISEGEELIVDPSEGRYLERAK